MNKVAIHDSICAKLNDLYARKNHDYGDSFGKSYAEYGMTMACIRLEDKLNRLKSLTKNDQKVADESIEDTLMDLANYSIMTLVERSKEEVCKPPVEKSVEPPKKGTHECSDYKCQCMTCVKDCTACCFEHHKLCDEMCDDYEAEDD